MARLPRFVLPGQPQHVIQRGNNRDIIFVDNSDYQYYLNKLREGCLRFGVAVHAYVLMTNHVHCLMTPTSQTGISQVMQSLGRCYVQYFNYRYGRTGTLWEGRFKASLIDAEQYLLTCYRYIELNPVRAGMVNHPAGYMWSSYPCNAMGKHDDLVTPHSLYLRLGKNDQARRSSYRSLFKAHIDETSLDEIRSSTNKAWVLGNDRFRERVEAILQRQTAPKPRGGDRRSARAQNGQRINRV